MAQPSPALHQARFHWRRSNFSLNYAYGQVGNDTDGAFGKPTMVMGTRKVDLGVGFSFSSPENGLALNALPA